MEWKGGWQFLLQLIICMDVWKWEWFAVLDEKKNFNDGDNGRR